MLRARAAAANGPGSGLPLVDQQVDEAVYQAAFGGGAALQLAQNVAVQVVLLVPSRSSSGVTPSAPHSLTTVSRLGIERQFSMCEM